MLTPLCISFYGKLTRPEDNVNSNDTENERQLYLPFKLFDII